MKYANASHALVSLASEIMSRGDLVEVRGQLTRELRHHSFSLSNPLDRSVVVNGRRNNIFATIAESMWVIAGRNDLAFLKAYVPRAVQFSDDSVSWRAGYGPRLRSWKGIDQIAAVRDLLLADSTSRRAVISLWDPTVDFLPSKDIPCTNWLSFTLRDGLLEMAVAIRSNDLIWGFSGINSFEWSLLQEMLAFWLDASVGQIHFFASSLHIYERHFQRIDNIVERSPAQSLWTPESRSAFSTPAADLAETLQTWFAVEEDLRAGTQSPSRIGSIADPLFRDFLRMLDAFWKFSRDGRDAAETALDLVEDPSLVAAGMDYFSWKSNDPIAPPQSSMSIHALLPSIVSLHRAKDAMYGNSWKQRGEQMAVLANLARKLDRLLRYTPGAAPGVEPWFDTAVDLFVYAVKYKTFLLDAAGTARSGTWSDGTEGFERLLSESDLAANPVPVVPSIAAASAAFRAIEDSVEAGEPTSARLELVDGLIRAAARIVEAAADLSPETRAIEMLSWST